MNKCEKILKILKNKFRVKHQIYINKRETYMIRRCQVNKEDYFCPGYNQCKYKQSQHNVKRHMKKCRVVLAANSIGEDGQTIAEMQHSMECKDAKLSDAYQQIIDLKAKLEEKTSENKDLKKHKLTTTNNYNFNVTIEATCHPLKYLKKCNGPNHKREDNTIQTAKSEFSVFPEPKNHIVQKLLHNPETAIAKYVEEKYVAHNELIMKIPNKTNDTMLVVEEDLEGAKNGFRSAKLQN